MRHHLLEPAGGRGVEHFILAAASSSSEFTTALPLRSFSATERSMIPEKNAFSAASVERFLRNAGRDRLSSD